MAGVAFTALNLAAEKMPDKVWHSIPGGYFKPPEAEEEERKKNNKSRGGDDKAKNRDDPGRSDRERRRDDYNRDRSQRPRNESQRGTQRSGKDQNGSDADDSDQDHDSDDRRQRRREKRDREEKPQRRPVARRSRNSGYLDRGYESDSGPKQKPDKLRESNYYFPPPPVHSQAVTHYVDPENGDHVYQPTAPYHPAQFDAPPGSRDGYYAGHPKERQAYTPADVDPETADESHSEADYAMNRSMDDAESGRDHAPTAFQQASREAQSQSRSSQRYTPHDYANTPAPPGPTAYTSPLPHAYGLPPAAPYGHPAYGASPPGVAYAPPPHGYPMPIPVPVAHFAPSPAQFDLPHHNRYPSPYDSDGNPLKEGPLDQSKSRSAPRESQSRGRTKSQSRARSQSRGRKSRSSSSSSKSSSRSRDDSTTRLGRECMTYGKRHADLGTGALGALAGGFIGRNIGNKSDWGIIIGAGLGGLVGAYGEREMEKRRAKQARRRQVDSRNHSRVRSGVGEKGGMRSGSRSRGGKGRDRDRRKSRSGYDSH